MTKQETLKYTERYAKNHGVGSSTANEGDGFLRLPEDRRTLTDRTGTAQEFVAYLYSLIRHDAAMVKLIDGALKDRYGDGEATKQQPRG